MKSAVFLDRDGVLNRAFLRGGVLNPPQSPDEVEILPGARRGMPATAGGGPMCWSS